MHARSTCFSLEKRGSVPLEWEDAAGFDDGDPAAGVEPRFVVVDGATEAYDAMRWALDLVATFTESRPELARPALHRWFLEAQQRWRDGAPTQFPNVIEELKFHREGSFATFVGCRLTGLAGRQPRWEAAALGDSVLFHVRDRQLVEYFPRLGVDDFGLAPDGISTQPTAVQPMLARLEFGGGDLRVGDQLFLTTDALAHWLLTDAEPQLWAQLADLDHDTAFAALVENRRDAKRLRNDDVTLLRVHLDAAEPEALAVYL